MRLSQRVVSLRRMRTPAVAVRCSPSAVATILQRHAVSAIAYRPPQRAFASQPPPPPFKSVFGVESIDTAANRTPAAPTAAPTSAGSALPTTDGNQAHPSQSPSAAFQAGAGATVTPSGSSIGVTATGPAPAAKKKSMKELFQSYGAVWVATYGGLYVGTLGSLYLLLSSGVLGGQDAIDLLQSTGLADLFHLDLEELNPKHGNLAVAWVATKFTEPIRLGLSIAITPPLDKRLRAIPAIARFLPKSAAERAAASAAAEPSAADKATGRATPGK